MPKIVKVKRSNVAGSTPTLSYGELGYNAADNRLFAGSAANQAVVVGAGGSGGSSNIVEASTFASLPSSGAASTIYVVADTNKLYRWDGSQYREVSPSVSSVLVVAATAADFPATGATTSLYVDAAAKTLSYWTGTEYVALGGSSGVTLAAPTNLAGVAGDSQVSLSWTAPSGTITDYRVQYGTDGTNWTTFADGTSTSTSAVVTGLTNGTAYVFRVAAMSGSSVGTYTAASSAVTPTGLVFRAIPTLTSNTSNGTAEANTVGGGAAWNLFDNSASEYNTARNGFDTPKRYFQYSFAGGVKSYIGGYTFTGLGDRNYSITSWEFSGSNDGTNFTLLDTQSTSWASGGQTKTFTLATPANYSTYRWTLTPDGTNDSFAGLSSVQLLAASPSAPTSLAANAGNAQVDLTWTAPTYTGAGSITGYSVEYTPSGGSPTTVSTGSTSTSYTITGLTNGTAYTARVAAVNSAGTGAYSAASSSVTPSQSTPPGVVRNLTVVVPGCGSSAMSQLTWSAPASDGGSAILGYSVKIGAGGSVTNVSSTTFNGYAAFQTVYVAARNAAGTGTYVSVDVSQDCG